MSSKTKNIHDFVLLSGFSLIIFLMISTAFLTANKVDVHNKSIHKIQTKTNDTNSLLTSMSTSVFNQTSIIFRIFQSKNPLVRDELILELQRDVAKFIQARESCTKLELFKNKKDLLLKQGNMSKLNEFAIKSMIDDLLTKDFESASIKLNDEILPLMKSIININDSMQKEAQLIAEVKVLEAKKLSNQAVNDILLFNLLSVLISLFLMLFLIQKQRKSNSNLSYLANTDTLTNLSNRDSFINQINNAIELKPDDDFSIVFFDIDYFKSINDIYGHEVGDRVLKLFSRSIMDMISDDDVLSRFGGDEFVLLINKKNHINSIKSIVSRLSTNLDTSYLIADHEVFVSASIGASCYPADGKDAKKLLKNADIAMYTAKQSGRNCHQFYSLENSQKQEHEHNLSHFLQTILKNNNTSKELSLVYQPLVNVNNEEFDECEALIRWTDENGNQVNTAEFIEIAEKSNLIQKVNMFVIEEACKQQAYWQKNGIPNIRIHINLSGNKRIFSELFNFFSENLEKYNLSPTLFGIELTERTIYEASEETNQDLEHFRDMGMKISIDDFGTGYSSLSYLKELPITSVKIDRAFIKGLPNEKVDIALVKAIITLAHSLDFDVVAEGVETSEQLEFLKSCNCNTAQGYLLHRPLSSEAISQLKLVA